MKTVRKENLNHELGNFTGTENYYRHWTGQGVMTDGVYHLADAFGAMWLVDLVFINGQQHKKKEGFMVCKLEVNEDDSAIFTIEDGNKNELSRQVIEYTDFPARRAEIWYIDGVALLPSEY